MKVGLGTRGEVVKEGGERGSGAMTVALSKVLSSQVEK